MGMYRQSARHWVVRMHVLFTPCRISQFLDDIVTFPSCICYREDTVHGCLLKVSNSAIWITETIPLTITF